MVLKVTGARRRSVEIKNWRTSDLSKISIGKEMGKQFHISRTKTKPQCFQTKKEPNETVSILTASGKDTDPRGIRQMSASQPLGSLLAGIIGLFEKVRMAGLEPAHCHQRQILSLMRLPIPPHPLNKKMIAYFYFKCKSFLEKNKKFC